MQMKPPSDHLRKPALKFIPSLALILFFAMARGQEININVSLSQPKLLEVDAGPDVKDFTGEAVTLGEEVVVTGGTPDFLYRWEDTSGNTWTDEVITVTGYGDYMLTVTDANNCSAADEIAVIDAVSVTSLVSQDHVIYPNPAGNEVKVPLRGLSGDLTLEIVSAAGVVVYRERFLHRGAAGPVIMETAMLPRGMYLVRITGKNRVITRSLIKD